MSTVQASTLSAVAGIVLGTAYFGGLWWNACLLATGRARAAVALMAGRFTLLGVALTVISLHGAGALLLAALGILLARTALLRGLSPGITA
ncbi:MAG TPA: ATP synthase subunit I [Acetobacteraceae bacterium]|nr:ATP synthase subunit I [Acetobacteraceae bacterium]